MSELSRTSNAGFCSPLEGEPNRSDDLVGGDKTILTNFAQKMRKEMTPWEKKFWAAIKDKKLGGYKFRRQQPIHSYIADFYNAEKRVIIELDGSQHADSTADKIRDQTLNTLGYHVIRIWNNDIDKNLEAVLVHILETLENSPHRNAKTHFDSPSRGELAENGNTNTLSKTTDIASTLSQSTRSCLEEPPNSTSDAHTLFDAPFTTHHSPLTTQ